MTATQSVGSADEAVATTTPPLVSVVIPVRNDCDLIGEAIASVCAQTHPNWEAIVVDDGSTDGTPDVVAAWAASEPRARLIRQPHAGVGAARNAGISAARGAWLLFLDADDWLSADALARLIAAAGPETGVVHGLGVRVFGNVREDPAGCVPPSGDMFSLLTRTCGLTIHACLVRRSIALSVDGFDPGIDCCEDWDFWQRIARTGATFCGTSALVAFYRQRSGSASTQLGRLLSNGLAVIRRGHGPDSRVAAPDPRYAVGAPPEELPRKLFQLVAWACAVAIGAGEDTEPLLREIEPVNAPDLSPYDLRASLLSGMLIGRRDYTPSWETLWPAVWPRLSLLLDRFEHLAGGPELAARSARQIAQYVAERVTVRDRLIVLDRLLVVPIDMSRPIADVVTPPGIDRARCVIMHRGFQLGVVETPVLSRISGTWLRDAIARHLLGAVLKRSLRRPSARFFRRSFMSLMGRAGWRLARDAIVEWRRDEGGPRGALRAALRRHLCATGVFEAIPSNAAAWDEQLKALRDQEMARPAGHDGAQRWDTFFATEDPWSYSSAYEQTKYERTLALIPDGPVLNALELACAEGHFTAQLAPRVTRLLATDISATALARAAARCRGAVNVSYRCLDLAGEALPGGFDLIVCSEVLYFMGDQAALAGVVGRIAGALAPGGVLLTAHACTCADEPYETAFNWGSAARARKRDSHAALSCAALPPARSGGAGANCDGGR